MRINFLGDSITFGAGVEKNDCYVDVVRRALGVEVANYSVCGTRLARQKNLCHDVTDEDFLQRAEKMQPADMVIVFGGTNDFGHGDAEIGALDSTDVYTFCGAVNVLIERLKEKYKEECICFILPLHRYDENNPYGEGKKLKKGALLCEYIEKLTRILENKNIYYIDLLEEIPTPITNAGDDYTIDGLHPNKLGHKMLAEKVIEYIRGGI